MKVSMLTFSQTGNTQKVGKTIEKVLSNEGFNVEHIGFLHRNKWKPQDADIIGIGCPCFEYFPAVIVPRFLDEMNYDFTGKKAFIYITSGGGPGKTLWHLGKAVRQTGAEVLGGVQIRGMVSVPTKFAQFEGRPNENDLLIAECFSRSLINKLQKDTPLSPEFLIDKKEGGQFFNILGPILTKLKYVITPPPKCDHERCNLCGNCVHECPVDNFSIENKKIAVHSQCIVCYHCWHVCPQNAISMTFSPFDGLIERTLCGEKMERHFGNTKPDEVYESVVDFRDVLSRKVKMKYNRKKPTPEYEYVKKKRHENPGRKPAVRFKHM